MPLLSGPRQLGQLSARTDGINQTKVTAAMKAKNADERFTMRFLLGNVPRRRPTEWTQGDFKAISGERRFLQPMNGPANASRDR